MNDLSTPNVSQKFIETLMLIHNNFYRQTQMPIPVNQFGALIIVFTEQQPVSISDISHILNISKQQMTTIIDKLVRSGLVQKEMDLHDRRRSVITLTPAGQKIIDDHNEHIRKHFSARIPQLTDEENNQLIDAILTFNHLIEKMFTNEKT